MVEVLDNILTVEEQDELENLVKGETFKEGNNIHWLNGSSNYFNKEGESKPHNAIIYIPEPEFQNEIVPDYLKNRAIEKYIKLISRKVEERLDKRIKHFLRVKINKLSPLPKFLEDRYKKWKSSTYLENELELKKLASFGQTPSTMVISCCDSRIHATSIFGADEGEFFIHRNIANLVPPYSPDVP